MKEEIKKLIDTVAKAFIRFVIGCALLTAAAPFATIVLKHTVWRVIVWSWNLF